MGVLQQKDMKGPNNILVDAANKAEEAVDVAKEAVQNTFQDVKTEGMDAITKIGEYVSEVEMNWQMISLVGLVTLSLAVIVWAGVKIYKSKDTERKKKGGKKN